MQDNSVKLSRAIVAVLGLALAVPVLLAATVVIMLSSQLEGKKPTQASSQTAPQDYAKSFHLIIREQGQNVHLWAQNLDGKPDFRQTTEANGQIGTQQLYVAAEKTLYASQPGAGSAAPWNKTENLEPKDIGLSSVINGPAVWALQNGVGDSLVKLQQGSVSITVKSLNEPIDAAVFLPDNTVNLE